MRLAVRRVQSILGPPEGSQKMESPKNDPHYYIGEAKGLLGGSTFLDPLGGLGRA